jgi:Fur family transcriptional regulator, ferric uptake regulator
MITVIIKPVRPDWSNEARARLAEAGQRVGAARAEVIEFLAEQECCRGAQEIHEALAARGSRIGLASVYRAVDSLVDCGAAQRIEVGDGVARYEPVRAGHGHHHHLVCDDCGRLEPFHDDELERAIAAVERGTGYAVATHDVVLHGACSDCQR